MAKSKKKMNVFFKILLVLVMIIIIVFGAGFLFIKNKLDKVQKEALETDNLGISNGVDEELSEYRNIAIFGVDSRADDYGVGNRSDCIMIASINTNTGDVKLISVYRDTYVDIENDGLDKITHAYSYGKAALAVSTLNKNLDLNIKEFVTVDFDAVVEAVDQIGGIKLDITKEEAKYLNQYVGETAKVSGKEATKVPEEAGTYNLNGVQAVAYSRIRYTSGGDYKRTERMRTVLEAMLKKLKTENVSELNNFVNVLFPRIYTNISSMDIMKMIPSLTKFSISNSIGWPYNVEGITIDRWYGVPVTLESNVTRLHREAFGEENYTPSDTVKDISRRIVEKTGYSK